MNRISIKKIGIAFLIILLLSRSGKILDHLSDLSWDTFFTLEPLRNSPLLGRYIVTVLAIILVYVTIVKILMKRK